MWVVVLLGGLGRDVVYYSNAVRDSCHAVGVHRPAVHRIAWRVGGGVCCGDVRLSAGAGAVGWVSAWGLLMPLCGVPLGCYSGLVGVPLGWA